MGQKILSAVRYVLWAVCLLWLGFIIYINLTRTPAFDSYDLYLSYGWLFSLCLAMAAQTVANRSESSSHTAFGYKLIFIALFFVTVAVSFLKNLLVH